MTFPDFSSFPFLCERFAPLLSPFSLSFIPFGNLEREITTDLLSRLVPSLFASFSVFFLLHPPRLRKVTVVPGGEKGGRRKRK